MIKKKSIYLLELQRAFASYGFFVAVLLGSFITTSHAMEAYRRFHQIMEMRKEMNQLIGV